MEFEDQELLNEFVVESNEHLADIENEILAIEEGGANVDPDLVNKVFRGVHSIKGAAGFLGLEVIKQLAHSLENVLNKIRGEELVQSPSITDVMLKAGDSLRNLINDAANSNGVDVSGQVEALEGALSSAGTSAPESDKSSELPVDYEVAGNATDEQADEDSSQASMADSEVQSQQMPSSPTEVSQSTKSKEAVDSTPTPPADRTPARTSPKPSAPESSIRVPVGVLDQLMNLAGELVLNRNHLLQALASKERQGLEAAATELDQVTTNLQESIMQTRMQPIGNVFGKFPRVVRDLSSALGKECKIEIEGKDVEVDKTIIEAIGDPLTHLIRNSVDHGVETPDDRIKKGKETTGTVWLRAFHKAGKVCIEIQDNGAGIDPNKLKGKAVEKGVITLENAEQMSDREAVRLIFHPGFSTAEKLSDVSGRGVGMDVVRTNIEKLGGTVDVESEIGVGTNIRVTLPLTLAIIPSMILKCSGERFAIPQANVVELVRLRPSEVASRIGRVKSAEVLRLRGKLLPLVRLQEALALSEETPCDQKEPRSIVVVETGQVCYGLVVDGIHDSEEIVVKPLGRHLKSCSCLAGATILGDGRIALILDAAGIASRVGVNATHEADDQGKASDNERFEQGDNHTLLLFSSNPKDQFAVPMEVVAKIERVRTDQIDTVGGCKILQYRGASLPLLSVEDHLDVLPPPEIERMYVIIFTIGEREVGLLAPNLDDIRDISSPVDAETFRALGVVGSLTVDDCAVRLLDVFELAEASHPKWFCKPVQKEEEGDQPTRILVVEDSAFFRKQVTGFLSTQGFEIVEYEDGEKAWNALSSGSIEVDIVVTDIEMPLMNGFELCERIKEDDHLGRLPVVALTSLSSQEDLNRGKAVGFDDYQVKMHRENLVRSVTKLTQKSRGSIPAIETQELTRVGG